MEESSDVREGEVVEKPAVKNRLLDAFGAVRFNIREGQKVKGKLTMQDCRLFFSAEKTLDAFLRKLIVPESNQTTEEKAKEEEPDNQENEKVYATEEIYSAYRVVLASLEVLQSTGIFSIEGSVELLDWMEEISAALDKVKDPSIRIRELKEKTKHSSKEKDKKGSKKK